MLEMHADLRSIEIVYLLLTVRLADKYVHVYISKLYKLFDNSGVRIW